MGPKSRGRKSKPGRKAKPHRSAALRPPSPLQLALREARRLANGSRLDAQLAASSWLGEAWRSRSLGDRDLEAAFVEEVVAATRGPRRTQAITVLHALAAVADPQWRAVVVDALAEADRAEAEADAALAPPPWAVNPATHRPPRAVAARRWADPWDSERAYFVDFEGEEPHTLVVAETTAT